jgi:hypothetical protein
MKALKGYKKVAMIYLILTIVNVIWVIGYQKPSEKKEVYKEKSVVVNL